MTINHGFVFLRICSIKEVSLVYDQLQIIIVDYTLANFPAPSIEKDALLGVIQVDNIMQDVIHRHGIT
jgi:hypothetical protein